MKWSFKKSIKQRLWINSIIYTESSSWVLPGIQSQNKSQANLDVHSVQQHKQSRKQGSQGQIPGLKSQVLSYNEWLHSLLPQPTSKLGHHRGNARKLPKVEGIVGHSRTKWLRSIQEVSMPFSEQSSRYLWQTISRPLATNQSSLWALLLSSNVFEAHSVLSP